MLGSNLDLSDLVLDILHLPLYDESLVVFLWIKVPVKLINVNINLIERQYTTNATLKYKYFTL